MKTIIKILAPIALGAGAVALVRKLRANRPQKLEFQDVELDDPFVDPVVVTEEVIVVTEADPYEDLETFSSDGISGR